MIIVPDVSFYQDAPTTPQQINFAKMKAEGASGVLIRAGQNTWKDPDFFYNYSKAKEAGLPRGIYWFYDSRSSPLSQASLCYSLTGADAPELGSWLDLEEKYGGAYEGWRNWKTCLNALQTYYSRVGIYTGYYYWKENAPITYSELEYFKQFPLWIANYQVLTPVIPPPWTSYIFWQYTSSGDGLSYGVESKEIDLNRFIGDEFAFSAYFELDEPPLPPPLPGGTMYKGTITNLSGAKVWRDYENGVLSNQFTTLAYRTTITGSAPTSGVIQITTPVFGYTKAIWTTDYKAVEVPPPPPPDPTDYPESVILNYAGGIDKKYIPE